MKDKKKSLDLSFSTSISPHFSSISCISTSLVTNLDENDGLSDTFCSSNNKRSINHVLEHDTTNYNDDRSDDVHISINDESISIDTNVQNTKKTQAKKKKKKIKTSKIKQSVKKKKYYLTKEESDEYDFNKGNEKHRFKSELNYRYGRAT